LSPTVWGSYHDYGLLKELFPPESKIIDLLNCYEILVDLGFIGIEKDYAEKLTEIVIPLKKPKKSKKNPNPQLTARQKELNKSISSSRVRVEHAIGGAKRLGAVSQVFRNKKLEFNDLVMEVACGLWNFHLKFDCLENY